MNNQDKPLHVSEGFSMQFLIPAILLFLVAAFCTVFYPIIAAILTFIGVILLLFKTGIEIDSVKGIRPIIQLFSLKWGNYKTLEPFKEILLTYTKKSSTVVRPYIMTVSRTQQETYNLEGVLEDGRRSFLYEFTQYKTARKCLKAIHESTGLNVTDDFRERQLSAMNRRQNRS